jgi:hypothetical protein
MRRSPICFFCIISMAAGTAVALALAASVSSTDQSVLKMVERYEAARRNGSLALRSPEDLRDRVQGIKGVVENLVTGDRWVVTFLFCTFAVNCASVFLIGEQLRIGDSVGEARRT